MSKSHYIVRQLAHVLGKKIEIKTVMRYCLSDMLFRDKRILLQMLIFQHYFKS